MDRLVLLLSSAHCGRRPTDRLTYGVVIVPRNQIFQRFYVTLDFRKVLRPTWRRAGGVYLTDGLIPLHLGESTHDDPRGLDMRSQEIYSLS